MSRQTPSAVRKRMADALYISYCIGRALRGGDDDISRLIRPQLRNIADVDLNNPDHVELVEALFHLFLREELSRAKLTRGKRESEETKARKATAKNNARVYYKEQRGKGYSAQEAWQRTALQFRKDYPDLYGGKKDEQLIRLWTR